MHSVTLLCNFSALASLFKKKRWLIQPVRFCKWSQLLKNVFPRFQCVFFFFSLIPWNLRQTSSFSGHCSHPLDMQLRLCVLWCGVLSCPGPSQTSQGEKSIRNCSALISILDGPAFSVPRHPVTVSCGRIVRFYQLQSWSGLLKHKCSFEASHDLNIILRIKC